MSLSDEFLSFGRNASKLTLDDASSINFKIQGRRNGKKVVPVAGKDGAAPEPAGISVSQQSFDTLVDNFAKLTQTVAVASRDKTSRKYMPI